jgi:hypothetical protein
MSGKSKSRAIVPKTATTFMPSPAPREEGAWLKARRPERP